MYVLEGYWKYHLSALKIVQCLLTLNKPISLQILAFGTNKAKNKKHAEREINSEDL